MQTFSKKCYEYGGPAEVFKKFECDGKLPRAALRGVMTFLGLHMPIDQVSTLWNAVEYPPDSGSSGLRIIFDVACVPMVKPN
jgi:hypothetical protein